MKNKFVLALISLVVLIFSFPKIDAVIIPHLDTSYLLAYNHLFVHHIDYLQYLTFTFGPLAFLKHPLPIGTNLQWGILFQAVLQFSFVFSAFIVANKKRITALILIIFFFAVLLSFDYYFYGIILLLIYFHQQKSDLKYVIWLSFLTALACMIKVNIGLISILVFGSYMIIYSISNKKINQIIYGIVFSILFFLLLWLFVFGNFNYLWRFITSFISLSVSNSSALTLNPDNNWYWVGFSLILFLIIPFIQNERKTWLLYGTIFLAFYASFKYAMSREDTFHIQTFIDFILLITLIIFVIHKRLKVFSLIILLLSLFFFYENSFKLETTEEIKRNMFSGFHNFNRQVLQFKDFRQTSIDTSMKKLEDKELPASVLKLIGHKSIDFYPWEISYFYVNDLNYKPRPMIQSGSLPASIDSINAAYLRSEASADFMLWEMNEEYEGLTSYDERYQLNSEQRFLHTFFNHYSLLLSDENFALYKKTNDSLLQKPRVFLEGNYKFDEWIEVPEHPHGILRVIFDIRKTFTGKLVNMLYKDASYYIEYKLANDAIVEHRFAPSNAHSGLWISPYLSDLNIDLSGQKVKNIRISFDEYEGLIKDDIHIRWSISEFLKSRSTKDSLSSSMENVLFSGLNAFEEELDTWNYPGQNFAKEVRFSGDQSYLLDSFNIYSPGYELNINEHLDSAFAILMVEVLANFDSIADPVLVVEHNNDSGSIKYSSKHMKTDFNKENNWNNIKYNKLIEAGQDSTEFLKIYIWNSNAKGRCYLDDFSIRMKRL